MPSGSSHLHDLISSAEREQVCASVKKIKTKQHCFFLKNDYIRIIKVNYGATCAEVKVIKQNVQCIPKKCILKLLSDGTIYKISSNTSNNKPTAAQL